MARAIAAAELGVALRRRLCVDAEQPLRLLHVSRSRHALHPLGDANGLRELGLAKVGLDAADEGTSDVRKRVRSDRRSEGREDRSLGRQLAGCARAVAKLVAHMRCEAISRIGDDLFRLGHDREQLPAFDARVHALLHVVSRAGQTADRDACGDRDNSRCSTLSRSFTAVISHPAFRPCQEQETNRSSEWIHGKRATLRAERIDMHRVLSSGAPSIGQPLTQYESQVQRHLRAMVRNADLAEELTQETFLRALAAHTTLRDDQATLGWLYRIATNVALDHLRRQSLPVAPALVPDEELERAATKRDAPASVQTKVEQAEMSGCVQGYLGALPDDQRVAVLLHDAHGLSNPEIAELVGCSLANAKMRVHRGRKRLHELLEDGCTFSLDERGELVCDPKQS